jgi:hypothetical protein
MMLVVLMMLVVDELDGEIDDFPIDFDIENI